TYTYTGNYKHIFAVPNGVTSLKVTAYGAKGSSYGFGAGGNGAQIQATIAVSPGDTYDIYIGSSGGYNGGGAGPMPGSRGVAGGGSTDIRLSDRGVSDRLVVAAGGGGGYGAEHCSGNGGAGGCGSGYSGGACAAGGSGRPGTITGGGSGGSATNEGMTFFGGGGGLGFAGGANPYGGGGGGSGYYGGGGGVDSGGGGG
ncbi:unnamed protein product, partial [Ectocarpus fasciculatus]